MNSKSFKIILILLSFCILAILTLQAFWIGNFYVQKMEEFNRIVYATLEQLTGKLQERENLKALKMTYFIQNGDTIAKTPSKRMIMITDNTTKVESKDNINITTRNTITVRKTKSGKTMKDSVVIYNKGKGVNVILNGKKAKVIPNKEKGFLSNLIKQSTDIQDQARDIEKLMDKMMTEIKIIDVEDNDPDTLKSYIKTAFENKGLFMPFEFSLQKINGNKKEILAQSKKFDTLKFSYRSDLSLNKVFNTHKFLFLQVPGQNTHVLAGMKSSLILSFIFSLIILSAFYYTIQLILKQKKLSDIKNDFVNNMTHELKTPIATISLALDAINNPQVKNDEGKFKDYTRILKEENKKLNNHVERVLQMALLDKGEMQLHKKEINLTKLICSTLEIYALQIKEQNAEVIFIPPPTSVIVEADEFHLQTVLNNLFDNALKYASEKSLIHITLGINHGDATIIIKDNGIGIATEHQEKIFDKFYRVQGGNLHDVKGFGLGLSYVKSIVEAHGGTIKLKSVAGKGSEFIVQFKTA